MTGKESLLHMVLGRLDSHRRVQLGPYLTPCTTGNSKQIKGWNHETLRRRQTGDKLLNMRPGDDPLDLALKAQATRAKINTWDHIKLKSLCTAEETINRMKGNGKKYRMKEDICKTYTG